MNELPCSTQYFLRLTSSSKIVESLKEHLKLRSRIESTVCEVLQKDAINREHHESQKEASEIRKLKLEHAIKEKMPKHSTTPFDQEEMDEYKQKDILFKIITPPNEAWTEYVSGGVTSLHTLHKIK
ncbi:hypothetical protein Tco_1435539 [Tanacetum coccineum]